MNTKITNLINLGPFENSVVYYDKESKGFYSSNITSNNTIIVIAIPITIFLLRSITTFLNSFHIRLPYFLNLFLLALITFIAIILTIYMCNYVREKVKVEKIEITQEVLKILRLKSRFLKLVELFILLTTVCTFIYYVYSTDFQILTIYIFATIAYTYIRYDNRLQERKIIFRDHLTK